MSELRELSHRLEHTSDAELIVLLDTRGVAQQDFRDMSDLAAALCEPDSIQQALAECDRYTLLALALGKLPDKLMTPPLQLAAQRMLLSYNGSEWVTYPSVLSVLSSWPSRGLPSREELQTATAPKEPDAFSAEEQNKIDRICAENSLETTFALTELVYSLDKQPARESAKGRLNIPDAERLKRATGCTSEKIPFLLQIAETANLITKQKSTWYATHHSAQWQLLPHTARWGHSAASWLRELCPPLKSIFSQHAHADWANNLTAQLRWSYPGGGIAQKEQSQHTHLLSELLGISSAAGPSAAGSVLLSGETALAITMMESLFPAEVSRVFLQQDLTIVATGPLAAPLDNQLRQIAEASCSPHASSYRVCPKLLAQALQEQSGGAIRIFLHEISATTIPQPLEYLIAEQEAAHGLVRIGLFEGETDEQLATASYLRSEDPHILQTISVDRSVKFLECTFLNSTTMISTLSVEKIYWALADARYPVAAEKSDGSPQIFRRSHRVTPENNTVKNAAAQLVNQLRGSGVKNGPNSADPWIVRTLMLAMNKKSEIALTVCLPNSGEQHFCVTPNSIVNNRMRGIDRTAGIERTFPLSCIIAVSALPQSDNL